LKALGLTAAEKLLRQLGFERAGLQPSRKSHKFNAALAAEVMDVAGHLLFKKL